jgi:hypothetical protein
MLTQLLKGFVRNLSHFVMMVYSRFDNPMIEDVEALILMQEAQFDKFCQELTKL